MRDRPLLAADEIFHSHLRPFVAENQKLPSEAKEGPPPRDIVLRAANAINLRRYPA